MLKMSKFKDSSDAFRLVSGRVNKDNISGFRAGGRGKSGIFSHCRFFPLANETNWSVKLYY